MASPRALSECAGKETFATWTAAARIAKRRAKSKSRIGGAPYRCQTYRLFHLGYKKPGA